MSDVKAKIREAIKARISIVGMPTDQAVKLVREDIYLIRQLDGSDDEVAKIIERVPTAILRMENPGEDLWCIAVEKDSGLFLSCPIMTEQIVLSYLKNKYACPYLISEVWFSNVVCVQMVNTDGKWLRYIPTQNRTFGICRTAITNNPGAAKYVPYNVWTDQMAIDFITARTTEYIKYVRRSSIAITKHILAVAPHKYMLCRSYDDASFNIMLAKTPFALGSLPRQSESNVLTAMVHSAGSVFPCIRHQTMEMCIAEFEVRPSSAKYFDADLFPEPVVVEQPKATVQDILSASAHFNDEEFLQLISSRFGSRK